MGLVLSSAIDLARTILNDAEEDYRYSTDDLLEYGNGALRLLPEIKPDWFIGVVTHTCVAGSRQALDPDESHRLVRVIGVHEADRAALDAFSPAWRDMDQTNVVKNWMRVPGSALAFEVYPPSGGNQTLSVEHVSVPGPFAAADDTGVPDSLREAVADYIVGMAEARDDEHVIAQRSAQFLASAISRLGIKAAQAKPVKE